MRLAKAVEGCRERVIGGFGGGLGGGGLRHGFGDWLGFGDWCGFRVWLGFEDRLGLGRRLRLGELHGFVDVGLECLGPRRSPEREPPEPTPGRRQRLDGDLRVRLRIPGRLG